MIQWVAAVTFLMMSFSTSTYSAYNAVTREEMLQIVRRVALGPAFVGIEVDPHDPTLLTLGYRHTPSELKLRADVHATFMPY